ncbi:trigger factor [Peloplasma aerotolerans]|uniref:Trigger factor n=1 Tax=Peloplasma aerotolerans TaxID=3044389 RepID=A0AAW6U7K4_9MOLU|nr:trigger factor [Mariniplasma sp. M4Ah]MDI6451939.1 trigger factor [Mariniplasma sp. M4Ah]
MKVEQTKDNKVRYTFDVTPEEFEHGLDHAFEHVVKDVELKGFRKGKVPRNIYETKFGVETLYEDALNHVLHHKYHEAQEHPDYEIVGQPDIDVDVKSIKRGETFSVSIVAEVKPEVTLGAYKGVEIKKIDATVTDEDVAAEIKKQVSQSGQLEPKDGVIELGDTAIFDFEGFLEGVPFEGGKAENHSLEIGSNQFIPGFEEQMVGMKSGEEKDINVKFPEQYQAENLAGKEVVFKIKLHEVKAKVESELNDEFVQSLKKEGITTVEQFREATKKELEEKRQADADNQMTNELLTKVIDGANVEIPQVMIDEEIKQAKANVEQQAKQYGLEMDMFLSMSGVTPEQFEVQIAEESKKRVQTTLVIEAIAKAEGLSATEAEVNEKYEELAKRYNMPVEEVKKYLPANILTSDVVLNKAYKFVIDSAVKV